VSKIWFITGSSRGFGRALVEAVLVAGDKVVATARKPEDLADLSESYGDQVRAVKLDVTSPAEVARAVAAALDAFGHIDVVVNNAGYGFFGAFEEMSTDEFKGQIDTNFWGVVHVTRAVVPILRRQGFGHIIQITSTGGRRAVPGLSGYHAAKFAVEGFSEALAQEIKPLGLKVTIVERPIGGSDASVLETIRRQAAGRSSQRCRRDPEDRAARGASTSRSIGHRRDGLPSRRLQDRR